MSAERQLTLHSPGVADGAVSVPPLLVGEGPDGVALCPPNGKNNPSLEGLPSVANLPPAGDEQRQVRTERAIPDEARRYSDPRKLENASNGKRSIAGTVQSSTG
jgi:hypothetical protein